MLRSCLRAARPELRRRRSAPRGRRSQLRAAAGGTFGAARTRCGAPVGWRVIGMSSGADVTVVPDLLHAVGAGRDVRGQRPALGSAGVHTVKSRTLGSGGAAAAPFLAGLEASAGDGLLGAHGAALGEGDVEGRGAKAAFGVLEPGGVARTLAGQLGSPHRLAERGGGAEELERPLRLAGSEQPGEFL